MGRAPCCEKMGVKRGPWAPEEDRILTNYIHAYGHVNWRALPKQAGLLRCGKSCRLRWTNYLRPDIKRGNFSKEEEETIIKLHEMLGNRWSAIAGKLPGRTDNEIKNVWHTHLKKRLQQNQQPTTHLQETKPSPPPSPPPSIKIPNHDQQSSASDSSSVTTTTTTDTATAAATCTSDDSLVNSFQEMDEEFWAEVLSADNSGSDFAQFSPIHGGVENVYGYNSGMHDGMDFWFNLFSTAGGLSDLPEF